MDTASKATLENEFGTKNEDECIAKILEKGQAQLTQVRHMPENFDVIAANHISQTHERGGDRNDTMGSRQAH